MRIATWNVNSLKARLEKVSWWLDRARPDVLLMQETKLADADAPIAVFRDAGYELVHHGEGQWNGVAIAARGDVADVVTNFGEPLQPARTSSVGDDEPLPLATEQLYAELSFQSLDLVTDGALRHAQLLGGAREALMACGGLEGLERIERGKAAEHGRNFMRKTKAG